MSVGGGAPAGYRALATRLLGFSTLPFLASVLPLIALPIVAGVATDADWAALNIGMGVGAIAAAVGLVGWNLLGTPLVAMADSAEEQKDLYGRSFYIRSAVVLTAAAVASVVAAVIAPAPAGGIAIAFAAATALNGITIAWYAVGVGSSRLLLWFEVVPRSIATAIAIPVVLLTGRVAWYGVLLCLSFLVGTALFHRHLLGRLLPAWPGMARLREDVADMRSAWGTESVQGLYANAPVPVAGSLSTATEASAFSSNDKIYRYGLLVVLAAGTALQGWVLEVPAALRRARHVAAFVVMGAIAVIGWVVLAVFGPALSGLLFSGKQGDPVVFQFYAIAFVAISFATPIIRNILIPARRDRQVLAISLAAAVVGIGSMIGFGAALGIVDVGIGFALSETINFAACLILALTSVRTSRREEAA